MLRLDASWVCLANIIVVFGKQLAQLCMLKVDIFMCFHLALCSFGSITGHHVGVFAMPDPQCPAADYAASNRQHLTFSV